MVGLAMGCRWAAHITSRVNIPVMTTACAKGKKPQLTVWKTSTV